MGVYGLSARNVREALPRGVALLLRRGELTEDGYTFGEGPVAITFRHPKQHVLLHRAANPFVDLVSALHWLGAQPGKLARVVSLLRRDPDSDRASLMLDGSTMAVFRTVDEALDLTVFSPATELFTGICGSDAVRLPLLLEYVAAASALPMGRYTQIAADFRMVEPGIYDAVPPEEDYGETLPLVGDLASFEQDLVQFGQAGHFFVPRNPFLEAGHRMAAADRLYRRGDLDEAFAALDKMAAPDWRQAGQQWLEATCNYSALDSVTNR